MKRPNSNETDKKPSHNLNKNMQDLHEWGFKMLPTKKKLEQINEEHLTSISSIYQEDPISMHLIT